jgi:predicted RNA-binding protein with PIN domain
MEASQKILIDGYNVIHADAELRAIVSLDIEKARSKLIGLLESYLQQKRLQVTLVFDGKGNMLDTISVVPGHLQVVFSMTGQSADQLIIYMLREAVNPEAFIVASSDNEGIGLEARKLGAQVLKSEDLLSRIRKVHHPQVLLQEKPEPSSEDVSYWMERFEGDVDERD